MTRQRSAPSASRGKKSPRGLGLALAALLLVLAAVAFRRPLLVAAGDWLVAENHLEKCDAAVVLGGEDGDGLRTRAAVALYKKGWVKKIVLSGVLSPFHHFESEFSLPLAVSLGVPRHDLMPITHMERSTLAEARVLVPVMEKAGLRSIIVVTSNYHSARARRIFLRVCRGRMRVLAYPAPNDRFQPDSWWQSREGLKVFFYESTKRLVEILD